MTVFNFFMHDRVLTTFSTDLVKTAVDWLFWDFTVMNIVDKFHTK